VSEREGAEAVELHRQGREEEDLAAADPVLAGRLRERLRELREALEAPPAQPPPALSEEERAHLRALGYGEVPKSD
jgi:hypothetical protein